MRAIPVASVALLGVATLSACVPAGAAGSDTFGFTVRPATVAPGGEVTLGVGRGAGGCRGRVTVTSPVFDTVTIARDESSATARVDRDARRGAVYQVAFACKERSGTVDLTIAGGGSHRPTPEPHHSKGVHAGEGGSIAGFDLKQIGVGALLVAGSVGAAHRLSRRRSGEHGARP